MDPASSLADTGFHSARFPFSQVRWCSGSMERGSKAVPVLALSCPTVPRPSESFCPPLVPRRPPRPSGEVPDEARGIVAPGRDPVAIRVTTAQGSRLATPGHRPAAELEGHHASARSWSSGVRLHRLAGQCPLGRGRPLRRRRRTEAPAMCSRLRPGGSWGRCGRRGRRGVARGGVHRRGIRPSRRRCVVHRCLRRSGGIGRVPWAGWRWGRRSAGAFRTLRAPIFRRGCRVGRGSSRRGGVRAVGAATWSHYGSGVSVVRAVAERAECWVRRSPVTLPLR